MTLQMTDIENDIRRANERFAATFDRGDAAGIAALYAEGGMLLPPGGEMVRGREAIEDFWQGVMDAGIRGARLETIEAEQCDDTAIEMGRYTLMGAGGAIADRGKYIVIWKEEDGRWKLHRDIWNTSQ